MPGVALHDWDGRVPDIAREMRRGPFDRVFLCVEERHVQWRKDNVIEAVETLKNAGMEVWLDPWRVGDIFAGETLGTTPVQFEYWANLARNTTADGVLIDEPDEAHRLTDLINVVRPMPVMLGLQPERDLKSLPPHKALSVSTYFFAPRPHRIGPEGVRAQVREWHQELPEEAQVWIQTFGLAGEDWVPGIALDEWLSLGREVNLWSWEACATVSAIRSRHHEALWRELVGKLSKWGY